MTARLAELVAEGLVVERPGEHSTGGRPASLFGFNVGAGVVLAIDAGASRISLAISDLGGEILVERTELRGIDAGPQDTLRWACAGLDAMLADLGRDTPGPLRRRRAAGLGRSAPGTLSARTACPAGRFPVADTLARTSTPPCWWTTTST